MGEGASNVNFRVEINATDELASDARYLRVTLAESCNFQQDHGHHREQIFILTVLFENVTKGLNEPGAILGVAPRRVAYSENVIHLNIIQGLHSIITWNGGICNHKIRQCWNGVFLNDRIPLYGRVALHQCSLIHFASLACLQETQ